MSDCQFPRERRITQAAQFTRVYREGRRLSAGPIQIVYRATDTCQARLGLAVPKRVFPRAVDRNAAKRQIRETFRQHAHSLPQLDCVVTVRGPKQRGVPTNLAQKLNRLWTQLAES